MLAARLRYAAPSGQHGGRTDDALTFKLDQSIGAIQNAPGCADQGCNPSPVCVACRVAIVVGGPRPWLIPGGPQVPPARRSARRLKALRGVRVPPMDSRHKPTSMTAWEDQFWMSRDAEEAVGHIQNGMSWYRADGYKKSTRFLIWGSQVRILPGTPLPHRPTRRATPVPPPPPAPSGSRPRWSPAGRWRSSRRPAPGWPRRSGRPAGGRPARGSAGRSRASP